MEINVEMFGRIERAIEANPEMHSQAYFEAREGEFGSCGTTRCISGWGIHLWGVDNGITGPIGGIVDAYLARHPEADDPNLASAESVGMDILGLNGDQMHDLFYNMSNDDALRMVKEYARGETKVERR